MDFMVASLDGGRTGIEVKVGDNQARLLEFFKEKGMFDRAFQALLSKGEREGRLSTIPIYTVGGRFLY